METKIIKSDNTINYEEINGLKRDVYLLVKDDDSILFDSDSNDWYLGEQTHYENNQMVYKVGCYVRNGRCWRFQIDTLDSSREISAKRNKITDVVCYYDYDPVFFNSITYPEVPFADIYTYLKTRPQLESLNGDSIQDPLRNIIDSFINKSKKLKEQLVEETTIKTI